MPPSAVRFLGSSAIVASPTLRRVYERAAIVAASPDPVWILGEAGSGKELVARAIHVLSPRAEGSWLCVNCATLPADQLLELVLGPSFQKQAENGTLVIDLFDRLPEEKQHELLLALQPRLFAQNTKLLVTCTVTADMTAIRVPNNSQHVLVPPLRMEPEQTVALARYFLSQIDENLHFTPDAFLALELYSWPGNVRELKAAVDHAAPLAVEGEVATNHLPAEVRTPYQNSASIQTDLKRLYASVHASAQEAPVGRQTGTGMLSNLESRLLHFAMEQAQNDPDLASRMLGISTEQFVQQLRQATPTSVNPI